MNPTHYSGENFIISSSQSADLGEVWHILNRSGCKGHTNHPIVAIQLMKQFNWQLLQHYSWGENKHGSWFPLMEPTKINNDAIIEAVHNAHFAWLN